MAIADHSAYKARVLAPRQLVRFSKPAPTVIINRPQVMPWSSAPDLGTVPTTAAVPVATTAGAMNSDNGGIRDSSGVHRIVGVRGLNNYIARYMLVDRLAHQGGLSGVVTTAQTTNLPTAALTRYTTGEGVLISLEIYTQIGTTGTTVTASYTNQAGTAGRTTTAVAFGATGFREVWRTIILPLQAGDTGVRAVASVTVLATTGTAGNFGVTLFKPLMSFSLDQVGAFVIDPLEDLGANCPEVVDQACLQWMFCAPTATQLVGTGTAFEGELLLSED